MQSYDGQLTFFEQEAVAFSRFLPNFLLPGPLAYVGACDSFITSTAGLELVAYKYSNLAAASASKEQQQQQQLQQGEACRNIAAALTNCHSTLQQPDKHVRAYNGRN